MPRKLLNAELGRMDPETFRLAKKLPIVLVLDNIRSAHNVGSIFRTADAYRVQHIFLCGFTPLPPHREIHKTALGATESVNWSASSSTLEAVLDLKTKGWIILSVEQAEGSISLPLYKVELDRPLALVFGNEVGGVDQDVVDCSDAVIELPQFGTKHSLNISVCAGIVLYDLFQKFTSNNPQLCDLHL